MSIVRNQTGKLYVELYENLRGRITSGEWAEGAVIPAEKMLCAEYGVSRITAKAAIMLLVQQGYLVRKQGKGTFVLSRQPSRSFDARGYVSGLIGELSHRINNPLAIIGEKTGLLQELLEEEKKRLRNHGEYEDIIRKIHREVRRAGDVTQKMTELPGKIEELKRRKKSGG